MCDIRIPLSNTRRFESVVCILLFSLFSIFSADLLAEEPSEKQSTNLFDNKTPEGALRLFLLGVALGEEKLLKGTSLPISDEDFQYLMTKPPQGAPTPKEFKKLIEETKIRSLQPGDEFTLAGGKRIVVPESDVNEKRKVLAPEGAPFPTRMYAVKGYWYVDAGPLVASRKAGAEFRKREKEKLE